MARADARWRIVTVHRIIHGITVDLVTFLLARIGGMRERGGSRATAKIWCGGKSGWAGQVRQRCLSTCIGCVSCHRPAHSGCVRAEGVMRT